MGEQKNKRGNPAWQKGVSGNPHGRPKRGETYTDLLVAIGEEKGPDGLTNKERLLRKMWAKAEKEDDPTAQKHLLDRILGTPRQTVEASIYQDEPPVVPALNHLADVIKEKNGSTE